MTTNKADILSMIRDRQSPDTKPKVNQVGSPSTEDWKRFKKNWVETVDGETIKAGTGKTNKEFFKYIKEDADDDKMSIDDQLRLRKFLKNLDE